MTSSSKDVCWDSVPKGFSTQPVARCNCENLDCVVGSARDPGWHGVRVLLQCVERKRRVKGEGGTFSRLYTKALRLLAGRALPLLLQRRFCWPSLPPLPWPSPHRTVLSVVRCSAALPSHSCLSLPGIPPALPLLFCPCVAEPSAGGIEAEVTGYLLPSTPQEFLSTAPTMAPVPHSPVHAPLDSAAGRAGPGPALLALGFPRRLLVSSHLAGSLLPPQCWRPQGTGLSTLPGTSRPCHGFKRGVTPGLLSPDLKPLLPNAAHVSHSPLPVSSQLSDAHLTPEV